MTEKDLHREIMQLLDAHLIPYARARMDKRSTLAVGYPDFSFPFRGCFVAWEVKVGKNHLTPEQEMYATSIERHGGCYRVIRTLGDAERHLREVG